MMVAPPLVLFSNPEDTDPTYSKFGSSLQQDSHFRCPTHADRDVSANVRLAANSGRAASPDYCDGGTFPTCQYISADLTDPRGHYQKPHAV